MIPILVTGGAGYIGSHACKALMQAGFTPIVYDNLSTGHAYSVKWGPFVKGDLNDAAALDEVFKIYLPQAVLHFAANAIVSESITNPSLYYQNNIISSLKLFQAMKRHGVSSIVFSSTCATYGHPQSRLITEEHPQIPISPYGHSKRMVEQILTDFGKAYGFSSVILRYFNAAGADFDSEIGEDHTPETHLIPSIIQTALGMRDEIVIYGAKFPSADGSAIRDYIHVKDLADAHVQALKWLLAERKSTSINLGTGTGSSVFEIIKAVETFSGKSIRVRIEDAREGDPAILTASNQKAHNLLHWTPRFSALPLIIESAWKWHQILIENSSVLKSTLHRLEEQKC